MLSAAPDRIVAKIIALAAAKTTGAEALGAGGPFVKGMLCNWLVLLGVVMSATWSSTIGKIVAAWLPITAFFAQGFEHYVINMFVIATGMFLNVKVTCSDWRLWNQIPVTLSI